jgi:hypothetical protein
MDRENFQTLGEIRSYERATDQRLADELRVTRRDKSWMKTSAKIGAVGAAVLAFAWLGPLTGVAQMVVGLIGVLILLNITGWWVMEGFSEIGDRLRSGSDKDAEIARLRSRLASRN